MGWVNTHGTISREFEHPEVSVRRVRVCERGPFWYSSYIGCSAGRAAKQPLEVHPEDCPNLHLYCHAGDHISTGAGKKSKSASLPEHRRCEDVEMWFIGYSYSNSCLDTQFLSLFLQTVIVWICCSISICAFSCNASKLRCQATCQWTSLWWTRRTFLLADCLLQWLRMAFDGFGNFQLATWSGDSHRRGWHFSAR